jgi:hypothetical protein
MTDWQKKDKEIQMAQAYNCAVQEALTRSQRNGAVDNWFAPQMLQKMATEHYNNLEQLKKEL